MGQKIQKFLTPFFRFTSFTFYILWLTIPMTLGQQVGYKYIENDPYTYKNFFCYLYPMNVDIASPTTLRF